MDAVVLEHYLVEEARRLTAHRLAEGKGLLPAERLNEQAEKTLVEQMTERARSGEHFPSSLRHN